MHVIYIYIYRRFALTLLISFLFFTVFYFIEYSPITYKYIWYEGLVVSGMMTGIRDVAEKEQKSQNSSTLLTDKILLSFENDKIEKIIFSAICASFFTYGFAYPIINEYIAAAFMAIFVVIEIVRQRYLPVDLAMLFLIEVMFVIALIDYNSSKYYLATLHWAWVLPLGYLLGKAIVGHIAVADKRCLVAYASLAIGMFLQGIIDFTYGAFQPGGYYTSIWKQFWTRETDVRNTFELEFVLTTSLIGVAIYIYKKNRLVSNLIIIANIIIQFFSVVTQGRSSYCYLLVMLIVFAILNLYDKKCVLSKLEKRIYVCIPGALVVLILLAVTAIKFNVCNLGEIYEESMWTDGGGIIHNVRFEANDEILRMLPYNPLGGYAGTVQENGGSHNLWLEYAREWGLMPFFMLVIFSGLTAIDALRLAFSSKVNLLVKYTLFSSVVCINLYYFMEPNAHAHRNFWLFGLFISGMIRRVVELHDGAMEGDMR